MGSLLFPISLHKSILYIILTMSWVLTQKAKIQAALSVEVHVVRSYCCPTLPPVSCAHLDAIELDVSTGPNITQVGASVGIIVHLMPEVDLGISAFADMVDGKIYMKLDTTAGVVLSATNGDPQVCLDFDTGLALDFGWKGDLGSYNVNTTYILFQRDWTLWKVRSNTAITRRSLWLTLFMAARNALSCLTRTLPGTTFSAMTMTMTSQTLAGHMLRGRRLPDAH